MHLGRMEINQKLENEMSLHEIFHFIIYSLLIS
jgi:hypothetical protein